MPTIHLTYRELCTRVESTDADELAWLEEFLAPGFGRRDDATADCDVVVDANAERLDRLRATVSAAAPPRVCLVQDSGPVCLPAGEDESGCIVRHDEADLVYVISPDRRRIELVARAADAARRTALMKLVRELALSASWSDSSLVLHAAGCVVDGRGVLVAGPKRAGKTSLLLHLLGAPGARLLANDRMVVSLCGERAVARAMPTIANLRPDTVQARFPDEPARRAAYRHRFLLTVADAERLPASNDLTPRPLACSPAQLARLFGVTLVGEATVAALLLPQVDPTARGIALQPLDAAEARRRLRDVIFAAQPGPAVSEVFALPGARVPDAVALDALWRNCVERLRVFDCRLGPDAYASDPAPLLARLLADGAPSGRAAEHPPSRRV